MPPLWAALVWTCIAGGLVLTSLLFAALDGAEAGAMLFPLPIAVYMAQSKWLRACGLAAASVFSGALMGGAIVTYVILAVMGLLLGTGLYRGWSFNRNVAAAGGAASFLSLAAIAATWDDWILRGRAMIDQWISMSRPTNEEPVDTAAFEALRENWAYFGAGLEVAQMLITTCLTLAIAAWALRTVLKQPAFTARFRDLRPPDAMVWLVIAVAIMWFIDRREPITALRLLSWNSGVALSALYWLNGLAVLAYALWILQSGWLTVAAIALLLTYPPFSAALGMAGLFDTWAEFRPQLDRWQAKREAAQSNDDSY